MATIERPDRLEAGMRLRAAIDRTRLATDGRAPTGIGHGDADDVSGTIATDDAIGFDPFPLLRALDEHGARVVVIGQIAGIMHGSAELTGDLDVLWSGSPAEADAMLASFESVHAELFDDDGRPVACDTAAFALGKVLFRTECASGDCCTPNLPWGDLDVGRFIERADVAQVDGVRVRFLRLDDLQAMRSAVGRPKDLRRVAELEGLHLSRS